METTIQHYLKKIEEEKKVKVLFACETGSRAWGFPSPDSDYDVRLVYMHEKDWYLGLSERKDTIEIMAEGNELDLTGWDIRKALRLLWKSNASLLERIQSPIIYCKTEGFQEEMLKLAENCYSRIATVHHYLSLSKKSFSEITQSEEYKLKSFFYALRASVACKWILEKEEIPPIEFSVMLAGLEIQNSLLERIEELVQFKANQKESYLHTGEKELFDFIEQNIQEAELKGGLLPGSKKNIDEMNAFFLSLFK